MFPAFPAHAQLTISHIWQEAHGYNEHKEIDELEIIAHIKNHKIYNREKTNNNPVCSFDSILILTIQFFNVSIIRGLEQVA